MCRKLDLNPNEGLEGGWGAGDWSNARGSGNVSFVLAEWGFGGLWGLGRAFLGGGGEANGSNTDSFSFRGTGHLQPRSLLAPFSFLPAMNRNIKSQKFKYLTI